MGAAGDTGGAHGGDGLALVHVVAHRDVEVAVVSVPCDKAVAVIDLHAVAQAAVPAGVDDGSAVGGVDGRTVGVGDIDGLMVAAGTADAGRSRR